MDHTGDLRQSIKNSLGSIEASLLWTRGLVIDGDGSTVRPGRHQYSFLAECECPGDCLRDHENE